MTHPSGELPQIGYRDQAPAQRDPCWTHLGRLAADLRAFGEPPGMHRVGSLEGVEVNGQHIPFGEDLPALLAGVGEAHTALPGDDASIEMARTLLLRILEAAPSGAVNISVYDGELTGAFAEFSHLGPSRFNLVPPGGLRGMLDDLSAHVAKLRNSQIPAGTPAEPWRVAVLVGDGGELGARDIEQLNKLIAGGPDWGSVIALGVEDLEPNPWLRQGWPRGYHVRPDPPLPGETITAQVHTIARQAERGMAPPPLDLVIPPREIWTRSAVNGLEIPVGLVPATNRPFEVVIGDEFPHAIITGQAGSGKSLTIKTMIMGGATDYSPRELEISLLDYKEGTEFANVAPNELDPSYLPHARLVGSNVNEDPEFGLNALRDLQVELKRRANRARELNITNYMDLRARDPEGHWPRKVMVIDEFQVLLQGPGGAEALEVLIDLARRGRSFGIHLVLASQNTSGIQALYARHDALFKNFPLRVAGRQGQLFNPHNTSVAGLPRLHLVVNTNSGEPGYDTVVRVGAAFTDEVANRQRAIWEHRPATSEPPRVFDANRVPRLTESRDFQRLKPATLRDPDILVAEEFSVRGGSAKFTLARQPGRNFAVVGQRLREVGSVMSTTARSLAKQVRPEKGQFSLVCLDTQHAATVERLAEDLMRDGHTVQVVSAREARQFFRRTRNAIDAPGSDDPDDNPSHYVFVYGADAGGADMTKKPIIRTPTKDIPEGHRITVADGAKVNAGAQLANSRLMQDPIAAPVAGTVRIVDGQVVIESEGTSGREVLRDLISTGPENGIHVIASFSGPDRLREVLGGVSGRPENIGGYITLGVPDNSMSTFTPSASVTMNTPPVKPGRARFYDRFSEKPRRTVIPYDDPSAVVPDDEDDI